MTERALCDVAPGERVEFVRFDPSLDAALRDRLIAYGIYQLATARYRQMRAVG